MISWSDWEAIGVTEIIEEHPQDKYSPLTTELFVYGGTMMWLLDSEGLCPACNGVGFDCGGEPVYEEEE